MFDSKDLHYKLTVPVVGKYNAYTSVNATGVMQATIAVISEPMALWRGDLPMFIEATTLNMPKEKFNIKFYSSNGTGIESFAY